MIPFFNFQEKKFLWFLIRVRTIVKCEINKKKKKFDAFQRQLKSFFLCQQESCSMGKMRHSNGRWPT